MIGMLRINEKWSIQYDKPNNYSPIAVYRYEEYHSEWIGNGLHLAMFYELLEAALEEDCGHG